MQFGPPVVYTRNRNGSSLAYQVVGEGELDVVFVLGWPTNLALMWANPAFAEFLNRLASFSRLILFDHLGTGMSDRGPYPHTFEDRMDEVRTVLTAVGSKRIAFFGCHLGGRLALLYAATHPDQTSAVVTYASHPATLRDDDYPWGSSVEDRDEVLAIFRTGTMDTDWLLGQLAPGEGNDPFLRRWWPAFFRSAASPVELANEMEAIGPVDIRGLLGSIHVPTLVLHRTGDRLADVRASRYMA
jgi:pimeloyl-ACP methyl ester carboxylesterase